VAASQADKERPYDIKMRLLADFEDYLQQRNPKISGKPGILIEKILGESGI